MARVLQPTLSDRGAQQRLLPAAVVGSSDCAGVPGEFVFAVKASRYLTHVKRLHDPAEAVARLLAAATGLGRNSARCCCRSPPTCTPTLTPSSPLSHSSRRLKEWRSRRHPSWHQDQIRQVLEDHAADGYWSIPATAADRAGERPTGATCGSTRETASRLPATPVPPLEIWARRRADMWSPTEDVYCYFNNDAISCAPRDPRRFAGAAGRAGLRPSRVLAPTDSIGETDDRRMGTRRRRVDS